MSSQEIKDKRRVVIEADSTRGEVSLVNPKADSREAPKVFTFDHTYGPKCVARVVLSDADFHAACMRWKCMRSNGVTTAVAPNARSTT